MADHNDVGTGSNVSGGGISVIQPQGPTYYLGTWDASTNTPTLTSSVAPAGPSGSYYIVSVAGTTTLNGISDWSVGDWVIWSGSVWQKLEGGKTSVTVGSTLIAGGATGRVLYDNGGTLGEYPITGTGSVVLADNPTLTGGGTLTANNPALTITQTWNNAAVVFQAVKIDVTATAASGSSSIFTVSNGGSPSFDVNVNGQIGLRSNANMLFSTRSSMESGADGYMDFYNYAKNGFIGLRLGGTTSSFPMLKVNGTELQARLADNSAAASFRAANLYVAGISGKIGNSFYGGISIPSDGYITLLNNAGTGFNGLQFGGTTSSFPMLGYESTNSINVKLADNSTYGNIHAGQFYVRGSGVFGTANGANVSFATDSYALFRNNAFTDFTGLRLGGTTSSFPMLRRNTTSLETKLADDSAYANHSALSFTSTGSTWASIPAAGTAGKIVFVSNAGTKGSTWQDDGTRWKPLNGCATLATLDTTSASIGTTETIVFQYLIPANLWQTGDVIRVQLTMEKSGATDTGIFYLHAGTAGTTADTYLVNGSTWQSAANRTFQGFVDFRLESATSALETSVFTGYGGSSVVFTPIAISSAAANALYISVGIRSSGATDTVSAKAGMIQIFSKAN